MVQTYKVVKDVSEALALLKEWEGRGRIMAGGTDLVLDMASGKFAADCIVDITGVAELREVRSQGDKIAIGAAVTHNEAATNPVIKAGAHALAKASNSVGSYQIRNCSTIAGNVVSAQPAADSAVALVALGAEAEIKTADTTQVLPVEQLYAGFGKSTVDSSSAILTQVFVPAAGEGEGSGYARLEQRKALALPMLCVGAFLRVKDGVIKAVRLAMAPVGVGPVRAAKAEAYLVGKKADAEIFKEAGKLALEDANPRDSLIRGSKRYRVDVLPVMVERALEEALEDANRDKKEAALA